MTPMRQGPLLVCFLTVCLLLVGQLAGAAAFDDALNSGRALYEKGQYQAAYEQLLKVFDANPEHPGVNYYLGRCAFELKDYENAVMAFDRALIADPDLSRVKLELGRCYYELGVYDLSKQYFDEVLAANPPADVRINIERFLQKVNAELAVVYFRQQQYDVAAEYCNAVLAANPPDDLRAKAEDFLSRIHRAQRGVGYFAPLTIGLTRDTNVHINPQNDVVDTVFGSVQLEPNDARDFGWFGLWGGEVCHGKYDTEREASWNLAFFCDTDVTHRQKKY